ncbi:MAG: hypothetical protein RL637_1187 [Pseudomonadota bacterium]|jgi:hypothetical protein
MNYRLTGIKSILCVGILSLCFLNSTDLSANETNFAKPKSLAIKIQQTWSQLDTLFNRSVNCQSELTWIPEFGLRGFYCHLKSEISYSYLQNQLPFPIFLHGPHSRVALNLNSPSQFGYYNPKFVQWLANHAIIGINNPQLQTRLKSFYQRYLQIQSRTYYLAYQFYWKNPTQFKQIKQQYLLHIKQHNNAGNYLQESFRAFADDMEKQGYRWYEADVAAGFWLRRSIDHTDNLFFTVLQTLIATYDAEFAMQHRLK